MSRTHRHIPHWCRNKPAHQKAYTGLTGIDSWEGNDPRCRLWHGRDGTSPNYYYPAYRGWDSPHRGYRDNYQGPTRKFFKRRVSKQRRRALILEWD